MVRYITYVLYTYICVWFTYLIYVLCTNVKYEYVLLKLFLILALRIFPRFLFPTWCKHAAIIIPWHSMDCFCVYVNAIQCAITLFRCSWVRDFITARACTCIAFKLQLHIIYNQFPVIRGVFDKRRGNEGCRTARGVRGMPCVLVKVHLILWMINLNYLRSAHVDVFRTEYFTTAEYRVWIIRISRIFQKLNKKTCTFLSTPTAYTIPVRWPL